VPFRADISCGDPNEKRSGKSRQKKRQFDPLAVQLPELLTSNPDFAPVWRLWVSHRREIKKPLTETQTDAQLKEFGEWGPERSIVAIRHTIAKGWQGIREPDEVRPSSAGQKGNILDSLHQFAKGGT
jgi:hypothetical protein